jgi:hypothetical protein
MRHGHDLTALGGRLGGRLLALLRLGLALAAGNALDNLGAAGLDLRGRRLQPGDILRPVAQLPRRGGDREHHQGDDAKHDPEFLAARLGIGRLRSGGALRGGARPQPGRGLAFERIVIGRKVVVGRFRRRRFGQRRFGRAFVNGAARLGGRIRQAGDGFGDRGSCRRARAGGS